MNQGSYDSYRKQYDEAREPEPELEPYPMTWSRWHLRLDVMVGTLLAWLVILVVSAIGAVSFFLLAADSFEDQLEDTPTQDELDFEVFCPEGQTYDVATNSCA
jgi:hypothetical protein